MTNSMQKVPDNIAPKGICLAPEAWLDWDVQHFWGTGHAYMASVSTGKCNQRNSARMSNPSNAVSANHEVACIQG